MRKNWKKTNVTALITAYAYAFLFTFG